jgi:segregation and condensation protein A
LSDIGEGMEVVSETVLMDGMTILSPTNTDFIQTLRMLGVDESLLDLPDDLINEPVEILLNFAKSGEIDPWDVDIVEVTDKFLTRIEEMKLMDLRISGRTLLYAAILLRMKSTWIVQEDEDEDIFDAMEDEMEFYDVEEYPVPKLPVRRSAARPVTLQELINELQKAETVEVRRKDRKHRRRIEKENAVTTDEILEIAHEENIMGRISILNDQLTDMFKDQKYLAFSELVNGDRSERVMTYVSLLFLASDKKIWLAQKELFGELYIHPNSAAVDST